MGEELNYNYYSEPSDSCKKDDCEVTSTIQVPLPREATPVVSGTPALRRLKVPVVLVEKTIQSVVEADIPLDPPATEIKRVKKHVFLEQVKLLPVEFARIDNTNIFTATRAKLFIAGHIRKNIEYASAECNGDLQDRIAKVPFSGYTELKQADFLAPPIFGISESAEANFLNEKTELGARLDKNFFQNLVNYNEQPFGELVAANFFELDFSPTGVNEKGTFNTLREKIVLDLTLKVIQVQQIEICGTVLVTPIITGLTPPVSPPPTIGGTGKDK